MEIKKLIDESIKYISNVKSVEFENNFYFVSLELNNGNYETLRIYEDKIETETLKENIIVIDTSISLENYSKYIKSFSFINDYNRDAFFSKLYVDEDENSLIIESSLLCLNLNSNIIAFCIKEIFDTIYNLKEYLSELGGNKI